MTATSRAKPLSPRARIERDSRNLNSLAGLAYVFLMVGVVTTGLLASAMSILAVASIAVDVSVGTSALIPPGTDVPVSSLAANFWIATLHTAIWAYMMRRLQEMLGSWRDGHLFTDVEITALKDIGTAVMIVAIIPNPYFDGPGLDWAISLSTLFLGALLRLVARVWTEGRQLREDVEATI